MRTAGPHLYSYAPESLLQVSHYCRRWPGYRRTVEGQVVTAMIWYGGQKPFQGKKAALQLTACILCGNSCILYIAGRLSAVISGVKRLRTVVLKSC